MTQSGSRLQRILTLSSSPHSFVLKARCVMPKTPKSVKTNIKDSSTVRRLALADFIDSFGDVMPVACRNCRENGLVCRVHIRSGRCNECNRSNSKTCNIRISENEWSTIKEEKDRLQARLLEIEREKLEIQEALKENADRAAEAIAVEEADIQRLEQQEALVAPSEGMALSPFTWSALSGFGDEVWEANAPVYLGDPVGTVTTVPGSS